MTGPLDGLDGPRPLPPGLRSRLEDALLGADARPLTEEQDTTLTEALRDQVGELLSGLDAPRALPTAVRARLESDLVTRRRRWLVPGSAAAAAAVVVGVLVLQGAGGSSPRQQAGSARPSVSPTAVDLVPGSGGGVAGTAGTSGGSGMFGSPTSATPSSVPPVVTGVGSSPLPAPASGGGGADGTSGTSTTGGGTSGQAAPPPAPSLTGISPAAGAPGTWVTLTGSSFYGKVTVVFGSTKAVTVKQVSATQVQARAPQHAPGAVQVVLKTGGGSTGGKRFLYLP